MKFLVLIIIIIIIWAVALYDLIQFTAAAAASGGGSDNVVTTNETYNLIQSSNLAKPGRDSRCGDLIVPYPFGIGIGFNCSISKEFDIYCNRSLNPARASLLSTSYSSIKNISDSTLRRSNAVSMECNFEDGSTDSSSFYSDTRNWSYTLSQVNKFTVLGCDGSAWLTSTTENGNLYTGCMVFCSSPEEVVGGQCSGNGCCQSPIPKDINYYSTRLNTLRNSTELSNKTLFAPCTYAFVGETNELTFKGTADLINGSSFKDRLESSVDKVLDWAVGGNLTCAQANTTTNDDFACRYSNSICVDSGRGVTVGG